MVNYQEEAERLTSQTEQEQMDWWNPEQGKHKVKLLKETNQYIAKDKEGKPIIRNGKQLMKIRYEVEVNNKKFGWGIPIGASTNSVYGQLVLLIASKNGTVEGTEFELIVQGQGKNKRYIILESIPLQKPKEIKMGNTTTKQ